MRPIIVEGPDNSGKSTLIYAMADHFSLLTLKSHRKDPSHHNLLDYHSLLLNPPRNYSFIADRHQAISDYIYGIVLRDSTTSSLDLISSCMEDCITIYCRPPLSVILSSMNDRPQMIGVVENTINLVDAYDSLFSIHPPTFIYDFTRHSLKDIYELDAFRS